MPIPSYQSYLKNIHAKTGKTAADFRKLAEEKGFTQNGVLKLTVKAMEVINWLKQDFALGQGHGMAIYALLKGIKNEIAFSFLLSEPGFIGF